MGWWFYLCPVPHLFMLQVVELLKPKGNLYFLISLHTQSNKHIFCLWTQFVPHKNWMKDFPLRYFVSRTTFNLKEYTSVNILITVIFNLNIKHIYVYNSFSKTCYYNYLDNLLIFCWIKALVCCHSTNYLTINRISWIFWNNLTMENNGYKPQSSQSLTS